MTMETKQQIYNKIYESLVDNLGEEGARNWANSTVKAFEDGAYDDIGQLIECTIEEAQK
jgi:hypothetical protein